MLETPESLKEEVCRELRLVDAEMLEKLCTELNVEVPQEKKGNKASLLKLILRFLHSEAVETSEDQGHAHFLKLKMELQNYFKPTVKSEPKQGESDANAGKISPNATFELSKLRREFKINGSFGKTH